MKEEHKNSLVYVFFSGEEEWHKVSQIKIRVNIKILLKSGLTERSTFFGFISFYQSSGRNLSARN